MDNLTVLVQRNAATHVPAVIPDYELPILQAIHGEDMVKITKSEPADMKDFNPEVAYDNLVLKYREKDENARSIVPQIYRNPQALAQAVRSRKAA